MTTKHLLQFSFQHVLRGLVIFFSRDKIFLLSKKDCVTVSKTSAYTHYA